MRNGNDRWEWRYTEKLRLHPPLLTSKAKDHVVKLTCTELCTVMLRNHNKLFI